MTERHLDPDSQIARWNADLGAKWSALQSDLDRMFVPLTQAAMALAAPMPGEHVVDIGCGCGASVLELARHVGPTGQVLGVDVSEPMLAVAARRLEALPQVRLARADAAQYPFEPTANLLFSRFGVMFFDDPPAAFANLRAALVPGGRLAMAVWRGLDENPWMHVPLRAVTPLLAPLPPPDPLAAGPFAFADPGRVRSILEQAGFSAITLEAHDTTLMLAGGGDGAAAMAAEIGPAARALSGADAATLAAAARAIRAAFEPYDTPAGVRLTGAIWLISARR